MTNMDISQIRVGNFTAGIIGLKRVLKQMASEWSNRPESEIKAELVRRLSVDNYIPNSAKEDYGKAFFREFRKYIGKPYEEEAPSYLEIKILGPGCANCNLLEKDVTEVLKELDIPAAIDHVKDFTEIHKYGVLGTPALIIDGKVKAVGRLPPRSKIIEWLKEAKNRRAI